ncbi:MAG TPA: amino acid adenylation domain-containing protein [Ktedonobacterales bacterium]
MSELSSVKRALLDKYLQGDLSKAPAPALPIPQRAEQGPAPLSFGQQQLWLLTQFVPDLPIYNECVTLHLPGPLDLDVFERSFNEFLRLHDAWRTSFPLLDGQPVQMIQPPEPLSIPVRNLSRLPEEKREAEALRLATEDALAPFDLAKGPLLRPLLIKLTDEDHRLFLTMHHIIFDGVAIYQVLLPDLRAIYDSFLQGQPSPFPRPALQYADFAAWQRAWLPKEKLTGHLDYWKQQLKDAPTHLPLPTDRPRPPVQTYRGSMRPFALSLGLTNALKSLARQEGATFYMVLVAAFYTLLYRYTGQEDMLLGTATGGRNRPETQKMLGFFLDTLVLRVNLAGSPTFRELLARVREVTISAVAHEDMPFELLVRELHPERNLSQNPLFQVLLTLEPPIAVLPSGWTLTQMDVTVGTSKFDLSLELDDRVDGLIGRFEYNSDLFDASTIDRMVGHWQTLLEGIVAHPAQRISELPLLTQAERQQLLVEWNATETASPQEHCLHQLFETQVERTPDALAVVFGEAYLSYRELNRKANQLAHHLKHQGVRPGVLVGLCVERSLEMVIGLLGILKAGGAYVPLDPTYPAERLDHMLTDARIPVMVTQRYLLTRLPDRGIAAVCLDADAPALDCQSDTNPLAEAAPETLAYVIYTSGSTGRPKGVQIPHRAVVNLLQAMQQRPGMSAADTLLAVTTLSFDIAALELFLPLVMGGRLVIASRETAMSGQALIVALAHYGVTLMQATPVTWKLLLAAGWQGSPQLRALCGGEALDLTLAQQLVPKVASLWNMYGPTETTIWSATAKIEPGAGLVPLGLPIAHTQFYILDAQLQPVPIGVPGELSIGGAGVARGYLNRPELTAERFLPDPFSAIPGACLYKTGDLVRYRPNGQIEFLGRLDSQVKVRGFRIEPGEIESRLTQHPAVQAAVVVARADGAGEKRLVAYIVSAQPEECDARTLRGYLKERLPEYMVPAAFVTLAQFPLTPNGKTDRRALPDADELGKEQGDTFVAPRTPTEESLAAIWRDILRRNEIGIFDNFFELGGHSLLATQAIAQVCQTFQVELSPWNLFEAPTISDLAVMIVQKQAQRVEAEITEELLAELEQLAENAVPDALAGQKRAQEGRVSDE